MAVLIKNRNRKAAGASKHDETMLITQNSPTSHNIKRSLYFNAGK